jgi:WD40 repeat protein
MRVLEGHRAAITCLSFSDDGRRLVSCDAVGGALIRQLSQDAPPGDLNLMLQTTVSVATLFGDDSVTADQRGTITYTRRNGGNKKFLFRAPVLITSLMASKADGKIVAGGRTENGDGLVLLTPLRRGRDFELQIAQSSVAAIALLRGAQRVAIASTEMLLQWNAAAAGKRGTSWTQRIPSDRPSRSSIPSIARLSGDGGGEILDVDRHFRSVAYSPDGLLLAAAVDNQVQLWNAADARLAEVLRGHDGTVRSVAFSPDGRLLASGGDDQTVALWDVATRRCVKSFDWQIGKINVVAFAPDGLTAAAGGFGRIVIWDVET